MAKLLIPFLFAGAILPVQQDSFTLNRTYKLGEKDVYAVKIAIESSMGSIDISSKSTSVVTKLYDDGSADVETVTSDIVVHLNGQEMPNPGQQPEKRVQRLDKFGRPVGAQTGGRGTGGVDFTRFLGGWGEKPLKVGDAVTIEREDAQIKQKVKGTVKLDSIAEGKAKVLVNLDVTGPQTDPNAPMKVAATAWYATADSKVVKTEGTIGGLPAQGGIEIKGMQFTYTKIEG